MKEIEAALTRNNDDIDGAFEDLSKRKAKKKKTTTKKKQPSAARPTRSTRSGGGDSQRATRSRGEAAAAPKASAAPAAAAAAAGGGGGASSRKRPKSTAPKAKRSAAPAKKAAGAGGAAKRAKTQAAAGAQANSELERHSRTTEAEVTERLGGSAQVEEAYAFDWIERKAQLKPSRLVAEQYPFVQKAFDVLTEGDVQSMCRQKWRKESGKALSLEDQPVYLGWVKC